MTKKKSNNKGDILAQYGLFVIHPVNLTLVLTDAEYKLLDAIRHFVNNGYPVSNSLLEVTHRITNAKSIASNKANLISIGFIKITAETQKGTLYSVLYNNIGEILKTLNNEKNPVNRLILADEYRVKKGLRAINSGLIERYKASNFDITHLEASNNDSEDIAQYYESEDAKYLNIQLDALNNGVITNRVYQ